MWIRKEYSFIKINLEGPQDNKDIRDAEIPSLFKFYDTLIWPGVLAPTTEKNQYLARFSEVSDVPVISESFGHAPVSPHTESTESGFGVVGAHNTDTQVLEVVIKFKDKEFVQLSWICQKTNKEGG